MKKLKLKYFLLVILLGVTLPLVAQNTGKIKGVIVEKPDGFPLEGAVLHVEGTQFKTVADQNGKYKIEIPEGIYNFYATYVGCNMQKISYIHVDPGKEKVLNFYLQGRNIGCSIRSIKNFGGVVYLGSGKILDKEWIENTGIR